MLNKRLWFCLFTLISWCHLIAQQTATITIDAAKKEKYFDNTIFVFVGDHGVSGNALKIYPKPGLNNG